MGRSSEQFPKFRKSQKTGEAAKWHLTAIILWNSNGCIRLAVPFVGGAKIKSLGHFTMVFQKFPNFRKFRNFGNFRKLRCSSQKAFYNRFFAVHRHTWHHQCTQNVAPNLLTRLAASFDFMILRISEISEIFKAVCPTT